jgi:hypothetical protein
MSERERVEKRNDHWSDKEDKELAHQLQQQAEKDRRAQEAQKEKEKDQQR